MAVTGKDPFCTSKSFSSGKLHNHNHNQILNIQDSLLASLFRYNYTECAYSTCMIIDNKRQIYVMIYICTHVYHCLPSPASVSFTRAQHLLKLQQLQSRIDIYKYSFLPRTIIQWNCLEIPNLGP